MQYFVEITLLPSAEVPLYFLWEKVYQQVHLALVETTNVDGLTSIGVSFPQYSTNKKHLGSKLRIFARTESELEKLHFSKWLSHLLDYVHIKSIKPIPVKTQGYGIFSRVQTKSSTERIARRKAKREGVSYESAIIALAHYQEKLSDLPYVHIKSISSGKRYRLFISFTKKDAECDNIKFSTYGLGHSSAVPLF